MQSMNSYFELSHYHDITRKLLVSVISRNRLMAQVWFQNRRAKFRKMERAKQQQQQPSQSSGQSSAAPAPASKPLPINGTGSAATKDGTATNKDIKSSHKNLHDSSTYNQLFRWFMIHYFIVKTNIYLIMMIVIQLRKLVIRRFGLLLQRFYLANVEILSVRHMSTLWQSELWKANLSSFLTPNYTADALFRLKFLFSVHIDLTL